MVIFGGIDIAIVQEPAYHLQLWGFQLRHWWTRRGLGFPVNLPNGRLFFRQSTGRLSDGRLLIDFLCQSLNASFLSPYMDSLGGSRFTNGANFAVVGSSTLPKTAPFMPKMRSQLTGATIVYVDMYSIKYDLIANSSKYGFSNPLMACCGFGGAPYNYNIKVTCGQPGYQVCDEGSKFLSWDGIHYTEAANAIIASKVLSTAYSSPRALFDFFCRN
ncbi:hypothetical protein GH714_006467 [Hevea brasiliensis]|uniref:Uncharacterized protein n=1 Tax=Hevea brasiliensis TaxID=3981 RepID=A0A6A6NFZ7_HEVBR|nr:hypothetical protein GH714_006467 [Hevea brasiliensis]